jgi:hypothetical protein
MGDTLKLLKRIRTTGYRTRKTRVPKSRTMKINPASMRLAQGTATAGAAIA